MKVNGVEIKSEYTGLLDVFLDALDQAQNGKGKIWHRCNGEDFEAQPTCEIARRLSSDFCLGQAVKKIYEARMLTGITGPQAALDELLGAINYLVAGVIVFREEHFEELFGECNAAAGPAEKAEEAGDCRGACLPWEVAVKVEEEIEGEEDD